MDFSRRDFLRTSAALAAAFGAKVPELWAADSSLPAVVWLQAQTCSGCSVSLLNSISIMTIDALLTQKISLKYHPTLMAGAGAAAVKVAQDMQGTSGYVLVVEGAIPAKDNGVYCELWPGKTALAGVREFAAKAGVIIAVGTCATFGGVVKAAPNPTGAQSVATTIAGYSTAPLVNIPGCPSHPDWIVGSVNTILTQGIGSLALDANKRPITYFPEVIHEHCPKFNGKCLEEWGCRGPSCKADCKTRFWNAAAKGGKGVSWCIGSGFPCHGCTEKGFPYSPFYRRDD